MKRALSVLIRLFPPEFRRTFGSDLQATFEDEWRERASWRLGARIFFNMIRAALMVRLGSFRRVHVYGTRNSKRKGGTAVVTLWQDLQFAIRMSRRAPGFSLIIVLVLAIGTGANSAIFSLLNAALLRPLPFHDPEQLVMLWERPPKGSHHTVAPLNFLDWSEQNHAFSALAAISGDTHTLISSGSPERLIGQSVSPSLFHLLGVNAIAGRTFREDDARSAERVVILNERLWRSRFGADRSLVGKTVDFDGQPFTVIGIVPGQFQMFFESYFWTPFRPERGPEQRQEILHDPRR